MSNPPNRLLDILGLDLGGYALFHARGVAMSDEPSAQPVVMTGTQEPIISIGNDDLLDLVASHITEGHANGRPKMEVLVHIESKTAYRIDDGEPFASRPMHVISRPEYDELKDKPDAFSWRKAV